MLALAQPAPVGGLKEDLIEKNQRCSWQWCLRRLGDREWAGGRAGRALLSRAAGDSSRDDEKDDLEIGLKEGPSLQRGECGRSGRSSGPARGLRQDLRGDAHRSLRRSPEALRVSFTRQEAGADSASSCG